LRLSAIDARKQGYCWVAAKSSDIHGDTMLTGQAPVMDERVGAVVEQWVSRWQALDADWQGVVIGAVILGAISVTGITIPW